MSDQTSKQEIAEAVGRSFYARDKAAQALGITLEEIRPGFARMRMAVREEMLNAHGIGHGGFTFALADTAFAYACNAHNRTTLAQHCSITYLAPAKGGDVLTAVCAEVASSGRAGVYDVTVTDQSGALVALFRGHAREVKGRVVPVEGEATHQAGGER